MKAVGLFGQDAVGSRDQLAVVGVRRQELGNERELVGCVVGGRSAPAAPRVHAGLVASGDRFVCAASEALHLRSTLQAGPVALRGLTNATGTGNAVDLNVSTNQLGTEGDMPPRIVEIFERWGFVWGGDWSRPDPMHFELGHLGDTN